MRTERTAAIKSRHRSRIRTCALVMRSMLPWCLFWMACRPLLGLQWPPFEWSGSFGRLVAALSADLATALPLALFAAGVVLLREMGFTRQLIRGAITISIVVGAISYGLVAWVAPIMIHRPLDSSDETMDAWPVTPSEILRDLRYVEANPPEEYSMQAGYPPRFPPNVLRWRLHAPLAGAVFGMVNILLGVLSAQLTVDVKRESDETLSWPSRWAAGSDSSHFGSSLVPSDPSIEMAP